MVHRNGGGTIVAFGTLAQELVGTTEDRGAAPERVGSCPPGDLVRVMARGPDVLSVGPPAVGETTDSAVFAGTGSGVRP